MKRNVITLFLIIISACFCGCSNGSEIEDSKFVTACMAVKSDSGNLITYKFYVSVPSGENGSEEGSNTSKAQIYKYEAGNFSEAMKKFHETCSEKIDLNHISLFVTDISYMKDCYYDDYHHISKSVKINPMIYYCVSYGSGDEIFECISSVYNGNPQRFTDSFFSKRNAYLSCTATELLFAVENKYYTSAVPVIGIREENELSVPFYSGVYIYSQKSGNTVISGDDFETYKAGKKKLYKSGKLYTLKKESDFVYATINPKEKAGTEIACLANKYSGMGFDIFNSIYYCKRLFTTYGKYESFVENITPADILFMGGEI